MHLFIKPTHQRNAAQLLSVKSSIKKTQTRAISENRYTDTASIRWLAGEAFKTTDQGGCCRVPAIYRGLLDDEGNTNKVLAIYSAFYVIINEEQTKSH